MNSHHLLFSPLVSSLVCCVFGSIYFCVCASVCFYFFCRAQHAMRGKRRSHSRCHKREDCFFLSSLKVSCFYRARSVFLSSASTADSTSSEHRYSHRPNFPPAVDGISACVLLRYIIVRDRFTTMLRVLFAILKPPSSLSGHHIDDHCYCWLCVRLWWLLIGVQR